MMVHVADCFSVRTEYINGTAVKIISRDSQGIQAGIAPPTALLMAMRVVQSVFSHLFKDRRDARRLGREPARETASHLHACRQVPV